MIGSLPVELKVIFIAYVIVLGIVLGGIAVFGVLIARLSGGKFLKFCRKISDFCAEAEKIDNGNLEQFDATCMDEAASPAFLEGWNAFKQVRFGYPSEHIDKQKVKAEHDTRRFKLSVTVFSLVSFLLTVVLAVSTICLVTMKYTGEYRGMWALALCSLIVPLLPLAFYLPVSPEKKKDEALDLALEDLDACVHLQKMVERKVDNAALMDIENRIEQVIDSEQNKPVPSKKDQLEPVPAPPKKNIKFEPFVSVLNECITRIKNKRSLRKLAGIIILAFGKFREPGQREILKDSIRRFIRSYGDVVARERAAGEQAYDVAAYDAGSSYDEAADYAAPSAADPV